jgi:hypothetical protein
MEEATMAGFGRRDRRRAEPRLDPVRWRRPGHSALIRLFAVAALLVTAAAVVWSQPQTCAPAPTAGAAGRPTSRPSAANATPRILASANGLPADVGSRNAAPGDLGATEVPRGSVGVPVRLAEPTALTLVHPGDRVDLLRIDEAGGGTTSVAAGALVLSVTGADDPTAGGLLLALNPAEAQKAVATPGHGFAVLIRPD